MKKINSVFIVAFAVFLMVFSFSVKAEAITWVISPDGNAIADSVTVLDGVAQFGSPDTTQPQGIYGAGFTAVGTSFSMNFDSDLSSWDAYIVPGGSGTGYWDAFVVTVNTVGYYWNLGNTDPIVSSPSTFVWGGTNYADSILENYITAPGTVDNISLTAAVPTTFYISLVLDTKTLPDSDTAHPSWGSFHVNVVPEPATLLLLGFGLVGLAGAGRKFKK